jgi:phage tail-like protein
VPPATRSVRGTALEHAFLATLGPGSRLLGAFTEISGIGFEYQTYEYAEGGNNLFVWTLRGRVKPARITLKAGLTNSTVLYDWAAGRRSAPLSGPQDLMIRFTTPDGQTLRTFSVADAVPVRWTGPTARVDANTVATEALEIAHRGLVETS